MDDFQIDPYEVTNSQYRGCVVNGPCEPPQECGYSNVNKLDHPVVCVSWQDANNYCRWAYKRLPTEAEWEKAARGVDGRGYPWGEAVHSSNANYDLFIADTTPIGSYPEGVSPYGVYDMSGNVWEWVADWHGSDYYHASPDENPTGPLYGNRRVFRGGSWASQSTLITTYYRGNDWPNRRIKYRGFRCARTPSQAEVESLSQ